MIYIISKSYLIKFVHKQIRHFDTKRHFKRENIKGMQKIILKETEVWIISLPLFSHTFSANIDYFIFTSLNKYNDAKQHQHYYLVSWRKYLLRLKNDISIIIFSIMRLYYTGYIRYFIIFIYKLFCHLHVTFIKSITFCFCR